MRIISTIPPVEPVYSITEITLSEMKQLANILGNIRSSQARGFAEDYPEYDVPFDDIHAKVYHLLSHAIKQIEH